MTTISLPPNKIEEKKPKKFWSLVIPDDKIDPCVFFQTRRTSNTGFFSFKEVWRHWGFVCWVWQNELIPDRIQCVTSIKQKWTVLRKGSWINWCSVWHSQYWIALAYVTWLTDIYIYPIILFCHLKNIG